MLTRIKQETRMLLEKENTKFRHDKHSLEMNWTRAAAKYLCPDHKCLLEVGKIKWNSVSKKGYLSIMN